MTDLPDIRSEDYEAFRRILKSDIPDTFNGWREKVAHWRTEWPDGVLVKVDPNEFTKFLSAAGRADDLGSLFAFIAKHNKPSATPLTFPKLDREASSLAGKD